jgi:hypothetical protein
MISSPGSAKKYAPPQPPIKKSLSDAPGIAGVVSGAGTPAAGFAFPVAPAPAAANTSKAAATV